jgi:hypothetical protein
MVETAVRAAACERWSRDYFNPIEDCYGLATVIVCRAGAMTLAEIAGYGLPAILVPYPFAIYQHQLMNARALEGKGRGRGALDAELSGPSSPGGSTRCWPIASAGATWAERLAAGPPGRGAAPRLGHREPDHPVERRQPTNLVDEDVPAVAARS